MPEEAYAIAATLKLDIEQALAGQRRLREGFSAILEDIRKVGGEKISAGEFATLIRDMDKLGKIDLAKSVGSVQDLAKAAEPLAKYLTTAADAAEKMKAALSGGMRVPGVPDGRGPGGGATGGSGSAGGGRTDEPHGNLFHGATDLYFGWETTKQMLAAGTDPMRLLLGQQMVYAAGANSGNSLDAATENAKQTVGNVPGSNVVGNMVLTNLLLGLTQDPGAAMKMLPVFAQAGLRGMALHPDAGDYVEQAENMVRSAEFRGALYSKGPDGQERIDLGAAAKLANLLVNAEAATNGSADPAKLYRFFRSAGAAGANLSVDELGKMLPIIQSMGPAQAGTALKGFETQFSSGNMSGGAITLLTGMGVIKDPTRVTKRGMGNYQLKPGAFADPNAAIDAATSPMAFFFKDVVPNLPKYLAKEYGGRYTGADDATKLKYETIASSQIASRLTGGTFMAEMLRNLILGQRDQATVAKLGGADAQKRLDAALAGNPDVKLDAFTGAITRLTTDLGSAPFAAGLKGVVALTGVVNAVASSAERPGNQKPAQLASEDWGALITSAVLRPLVQGGGKLLGRMGLSGAAKVAGLAVPGADIVSAGLLATAAADTARAVAEYMDKKFPALARIDEAVGLLKKGPSGSSGDPIHVVGSVATPGATAALTTALRAPPTTTGADPRSSPARPSLPTSR